jgi:catechol 2,3-dioxygenase-like lactoylglutathione lyase family enzyme
MLVLERTEQDVIKVRGITHINLVVADVERSKTFYMSVFGLEEMFSPAPTLTFLKVSGTDDVIALQQGPEAPRAEKIDHFGFSLAAQEDRELAIEQVIAAGGSLVERGSHGPGNPYAYVRDPDGYMIEL